MLAANSLSDSFPSVPSPEDIENFCKAAQDGDRDKVREYLDQYGAAIINQRDRINARAITWAAFAGHIEVVELLLERGADINAGGTDDKPALTWAAETGRREVAKLLLDKGAETGVQDMRGETAMDYAKRRGEEDIAAMIEARREQKAEQERREARRRDEEAARALSNARIEMLRKNPPPKLKKKSPRPNR